MMSKVPIALRCAASLLALSGAGVFNSYTSVAVGQAPDEFTRERRPVPEYHRCSSHFGMECEQVGYRAL